MQLCLASSVRFFFFLFQTLAHFCLFVCLCVFEQNSTSTSLKLPITSNQIWFCLLTLKYFQRRKYWFLLNFYLKINDWIHRLLPYSISCNLQLFRSVRLSVQGLMVRTLFGWSDYTSFDFRLFRVELHRSFLHLKIQPIRKVKITWRVLEDNCWGVQWFCFCYYYCC